MASSRPSSPHQKPAAKPAAGNGRRAPSPTALQKSKTRNPKPTAQDALNRRLDIFGVFLALVGLLTLLSLFSGQRGWLTTSWVTLISKIFGWGMYLFPLALLGVGIWLLLRHFESFPRLELESAVGLLLLYGNLLVWLHFFTYGGKAEAIFPLAQSGRGGGYLGGVLLNLLHTAFGQVGAFVVLLAWLLIALAITRDVPVLGLFDWLASLKRFFEKRGSRPASPPLTASPLPTANAKPESPLAGKATPVTPSAAAPPTGVSAAVEWVLPPRDEILESGGEVNYDDEIDRQRAHIIEETLASFGAPAKVVEINRGPTVTQFGVEPGFTESRGGSMRVRVSKISTLANDLALALSSKRIRVQAPVPGKGFIGIEVPNEEIALVTLRDVIESEAFTQLTSPLRFALGQDVSGASVAADLAAMPHLLIAGATGAGKSVCVNALITCLLLHSTPDDVRLIMVDPKRVELTGYNGIPHLLAPVVVELERVVGALQWVTREMDVRYHKLAQAGARNIADYNARMAARGEKKLPYLVVIIDELADLMMLAPEDTERTITRLAQLARATGIHLIIATQRPSVDVVTGLIKANLPARIAFMVASNTDSRVILDQPGAETLLGRGDMLFQSPDAPTPARLQGVFVSDAEIQRLVIYWRTLAGSVQSPAVSIGGAAETLPAGIPLKQLPMWEEVEAQEELDPLYAEAVDVARRQGRASISMLQRRLRIGYTRAARLIETMQAKGIIGKESTPQGYDVLDYGPAAPPLERQGD